MNHDVGVADELEDSRLEQVRGFKPDTGIEQTGRRSVPRRRDHKCLVREPVCDRWSDGTRRAGDDTFSTRC
jgi:hypothetical protein